MAKIKYLVLLLVAMNACLGAFGQAKKEAAPMMVLNNGIKTLYPQRMGFAGATSLADVLKASPEMLFDSDGTLNPNYQLKVDGVACNQNPHLVLVQTSVREVESVSVITDPSVADGKQGVVGVIDVKTRNYSEGFSGFVNAMAGTGNNYLLSNSMGWRKGNWQISGTLTGMYDKSKTDTRQRLIGAEQDRNLQISEVKLPTQYARFITHYDDGRDNFDFRITETYNPEKDATTLSDGRLFEETSQTLDYFQLKGAFTYGHVFSPKWNFNVGAGLEWVNQPLWRHDIDFHYKTHDVVVDPSMHLNFNSLKGFTVTFDANTKFVRTGRDTEDNAISFLFNINSSEFDPVLQLHYELNDKWLFNVGERLLYRYYSATEKEQRFVKWSNDYLSYMTNAHVTYRPMKEHSIQVGYSKRVQLPSFDQLYPNFVFTSPLSNQMLMGNENLEPMKHNVYDINYTYSGKRISASLALRFYDTKNKLEQLFDHSIVIGGLNKTPTRVVDYYKWQNVGASHATELSASAVGDFNWFSMSVGFNLQYEKVTSQPDDGRYFWSFRVCPVVQLPYEMQFSTSVSYFSNRKTLSQGFDPSWLATMRMAKTLGKFDLFVQWENIGLGEMRSYSIGNTPNTETFTNQHKQQVLFGATFNF